MSDTPEQEQPRKGRSNAILTYEEVSNIHLGIQKVGLKLEAIETKLEEMKDVHIDHEVRIRALELTAAGSAAAGSTSKYLYGAIWPVVTLIMAVLSYLK